MNINFEFQPTLEGARITVRPIATTDWVEMFAAAADPEIWVQHPATDRYTERVFREYFDSAIECESAFTFVDRQSGRVIGSSRCHGFDSVNSEVEIGWTFLSRDYWGGSYNLEIKKMMLEHAWLFVDTVVFWVGEKNVRSRRAMEKIGGVLRDGVQFRDISGEDPDVVYEVRKNS